MPETDNLVSSAAPLEALHAENVELRERIAELESRIAESNKQVKDRRSADDQEFAGLLEEKTEVIRELHLKIQDLQAQLSAAPAQQTEQQAPAPAETPKEDDLVALGEELERERVQLQEDEKALMQQMRTLEVQMSRERAELARQRSDIERLHMQVQHELELASKEAAMRERLRPLMRQYQTILRNGSSVPPERAVKEAPAQPAPVNGGGSSGLFRRLFGAG